MGFTDLLDELSTIGPSLVAAQGERGTAVGDARNEVNAALFPIWKWLDGLKEAAARYDVDWVTLDDAPSSETIEEVKGSLALLKSTVQRGDVEAVRSELTNMGELLREVAAQTDQQLERRGIDREQRNRLLLPLHAQLSDLAVTAGSSEALTLARRSLGQVGEKRLSEGIAERAGYEQVRADFFRYSAIAAFLFSIFWLAFSYLAFRSADHGSGSERISEAVAKIAIGAAVLGLAVYLARESRAHRGRSSAWQSVQLQMDTIDLYCASLPVEHRDAIRLSFGLAVFSGSRLFGSGAEDSGSGPDDGAAAAPLGTDLERISALLGSLGRRTAPGGGWGAT